MRALHRELSPLSSPGTQLYPCLVTRLVPRPSALGDLDAATAARYGAFSALSPIRTLVKYRTIWQPETLVISGRGFHDDKSQEMDQSSEGGKKLLDK